MAVGEMYHVVGVFENEQTARDVVDDLLANGFRRDDIHLSGTGDFRSDIASGGAALTGTAPKHHHGGFFGWFENLFSSDDDRDKYTKAIEKGNCIVAVDSTDEMRDRAVDILKDHDAIDVDKNKEDISTTSRTTGTTTAGRMAQSGRTGQTGRTDINRGEQKAIPVVEEELQVGKRVVQRGGVRVYTHTVDKPVQEQVNLREEHVRVDRRPADRPVTDADRAALRDQNIEVVETTEEPVVSKTARVVEEVVIGKDVKERTETVRDSVRHTEVDVQPIGNEGTRKGATTTGMGNMSTYDTDFRRDFDTQYRNAGGRYEDYAPLYQYGCSLASDPRFKGRNWNDVEPQIRSEYSSKYPNASWDRMRGAVRYGWDKVTGKH